MIARTWYLVRHGETEWNAAARLQGQLDSRLTPLGRDHARTSAQLLARAGVDALFASPLGRVRETVEIVQQHVALPVTFDDRLKEWHSGDWSGSVWTEVETRWPDVYAAWTRDRYHTRAPNGENFVDLVTRAAAFAADMTRVPGASVAVIAHGFLHRALAAVLLSLSPEATLRIRQRNDVVIRIVRDARGQVTSVDHVVGGARVVAGLPETTVDPTA